MGERETVYDVVGLGEVLLRLASRAPERLEQVRQLDVSFGGTEANVLAALARLGLRTAWLSALPRNAWGDRVERELRGHGVDVSHVVCARAGGSAAISSSTGWDRARSVSSTTGRARRSPRSRG